ncbi:YgfZ/GcvT domain-containing protein [Amorphus coralli]|uniref:CAF17-like 4Fe-4S cluster assembly/insertion protein YgfZ n=1 Tax=Amorphus coralli TaxID=340680 RepID=UPI00037F1DDC|nr:folate-binding protein YgfZ [Amorphus coralli]
MSGQYISELDDRAVVRVAGADARTFLHNLLTADLERLVDGEARYGALLTPQGKVLVDGFVMPQQDGFLIDVPRASAPEFLKRLQVYKLRAKAEISDVTGDYRVYAIWGTEAAPMLPGVVVRDPRLAALGFRALVPRATTVAGAHVSGYTRTGPAAYHAHRIANGIPESGRDFALGDTFPHDADMDQLSGVDFAKGCYVGQEVVSRMHHRGTARRRIVMVRGAETLPPPGAQIIAGDRPIGTLGSTAGQTGLALVRLDRAKAAMDAGQTISADGHPITLSLPDWAGFGWPEVQPSSA